MKSFVKRMLPPKLLQLIVETKLEFRGRKNERHYKGNAVLCPCCGKRFGKFMDYWFMDYIVSKATDNRERFAEDRHKNTICPYCLSLPRHRIVCNHFENKKELLPKNNIIMFGAERSIKKCFNRNGCRYKTADLFNPTADFKVDIQNIQFPDESFGLIICNHVLQHVQDYKIALSELKRVLKNDGILELTVATNRNLETVYEDPDIVSGEDRNKHFGQHDYARIFGNDFEKILTEHGFLVEVVKGDNCPDEIIGVIGPGDQDDNKVYICKKASEVKAKGETNVD